MALDQIHAEADPAAPGKSSPTTSMRCESCGYGVTRQVAPERCPMCGGADWEHEGWRPFSDLLRAADPG